MLQPKTTVRLRSSAGVAPSALPCMPRRERERTCFLLYSDSEVGHLRLVDCFGQTGRREIAIGRQLEWREIQQFPEVGRREQHVRKSAPQSSVTVHQM